MSTTDRRAFQLVKVDDANTQKALEETRDIAKASQEQAFAGTDVEVVLQAGVATNVAHKLGRVPKGRIITGQAAAGVLVDGGKTAQHWTLTSTITTQFQLRFY